MLYDQSLINVPDVRSASGNEWIEQADFHVPDDQPLSKGGEKERIKWYIEVWAKKGFGFSVMHSFDVMVVNGDENPS